jgi:hypothetical protein
MSKKMKCSSFQGRVKELQKQLKKEQNKSNNVIKRKQNENY